MTPLSLVAGLLLGSLLVVLLPEAAHAWGPGTHVYLGMEVLRSLESLAPWAASLLEGHGLQFLYGSLAADIPMGKSYTPAERHPHAWSVGRDMLDEVGDEPDLKAAALGYLAHLAADVVAHEAFVPRMLLLTSSTRSLGHSYWEHRMDASVGALHLRLARAAVTEFDHDATDDLLDRSLERTFLSFDTNRRIFRGMVRIADDQRWQSIFDTVVENSRWDLERRETRRYLEQTFEFVMDFLLRGEDSRPAQGDPTGRDALARAKRIRRQILMEEGWDAGDSLRAAADRFFPLPRPDGERWEERGSTPEVASRLELRLLFPRTAEPARPDGAPGPERGSRGSHPELETAG